MRYLTLTLCAAFASLILFFSQSMAQIVVPTKMNVELQDLSKEARKEVECLAQNMFFEAGQEPRQGQLGVAFVTHNRLISGKYPTTYCEVVKQKVNNVCQFSWYCEAAARKRLLTLSNNPLYNDITELALRFYLYTDEFDDPTKGALFFHADYVKPTWNNMRRTAYIGRHIFYNRVKQGSV
jgi:spore germination cell wall hydrolase CwlJ-like protein